MNTSDKWTDPEADQPETVNDNHLRSEDTAADDSQDVDEAADAATGDMSSGPDEAVFDAEAGDVSFPDAGPEVMVDEDPPNLAESIGPDFAVDTLPLLDASGNAPADFDALYRSLRQWEAAAADAPGDPRFTPKPTTKGRNELLMLDRGPTVPVVWLDRATMTPVKYAGEKPESPTEDFSLPMDLAGRVGVADHAESALGIAQPVVLVDLADRGRFTRAELEAFAERMTAVGERTAQEVNAYERWWQACEDRAINGDWT